jgi:hypothetical protein
MRPLTLIVCAAAVALPVAASAATAAPGVGVDADARCLMVMATFTGAKDPVMANTAQMGVAFFAGRIKARDPSYNLGVRLKAVAASMNGKPMQAEADRCAPQVMAFIKELDEAQKAFGPPPAAASKPGAPKP